jgi:radical SAM superfamily enzyme YgiQ (UPF0313 family)
MSLLALGALLEERHPYEIVDGNLVADPLAELSARILGDGRGVLLGVTVMPGPQLERAAPLCRELKWRHPRLTVVWGGYFPTQHWDVCLRSGYVDFVVRGHGERAFAALADALAAGEVPGEIPGLARRDGGSGGDPDAGPDGGVVAPLPSPQELPDFPYHRVELERYVRATFLGRRTLAHHSSYGCPFKCNFCAVVNLVDGGWKAQSAERAAAVARRLHDEHGADAIELYDNNFFVHEARTAEFAERIAGLGVGWWGESRIDTLLRYSEETWEAMAGSGLRMVFLGAESGSDETLARMNKGGTAKVADTLAIVEQAARFGIVPELSFVLGNPPDPEADAESTIRFVRRVKEINPHAEIILYLYTPVPLAGTLYEEAKQQGFRFPESLEEWVSPQWLDFAQRRSASLPWLEDPLRRRMLEFERVLNGYYPTSTDQRLRGLRRAALRALAGWRYRLGFYRWPLELELMQRLIAYQRPETSGF